MTDTTKRPDYSFANTAELLRACLYALNRVPNTRIDHDMARDTYALASQLTAYLGHVSRLEHKAAEGRGPFRLEVHVCGMRPDEDGLTLADYVDEVTQWDVELRLHISEGGHIESLIERECASEEEAADVAQKMLRLFPTASLHQQPES